MKACRFQQTQGLISFREDFPVGGKGVINIEEDTEEGFGNLRREGANRRKFQSNSPVTRSTIGCPENSSEIVVPIAGIPENLRAFISLTMVEI